MSITPTELFSRHSDLYVELYIYDIGYSIRVEDLYQAFKGRLMQELAVASPELLEPAHLFDNTDEDEKND